MARATVVLLALLALAATADARPGRPLTAEEQQALVAVVGEREWGALPRWRQHVVRARYAHFLDQPEPVRARIRRGPGLRAFLLPPPEIAPEELPGPLREAVARLPEGARERAAKLAALRLRHLRLDRHLSLLPFPDRRPLFERLFPEPFDPAPAADARVELQRRVARALAGHVRDALREREEAAPGAWSPGERRRQARAMVAEITRREEQRIVERVLAELERIGAAGGPGRRPRGPGRGPGPFPALARLELILTPRQGELIRWAFDPRGCPLIDPEFLGPPPTDPEERRQWEQDWRILARLDLLCEAGLPVELVLHLAGSSSPEDFFRGVARLRGPEFPPPAPPR